jgi:hypothetical protein
LNRCVRRQRGGKARSQATRASRPPAALDAVKTWLYRPYLLDGQPVEVKTTVDVIFKLSR